LVAGRSGAVCIAVPSCKPTSGAWSMRAPPSATGWLCQRASVIGRTAAVIPVAASTMQGSSQNVLEHRLMECLPHQSGMLHSPTSDDGDEDQSKRPGDAEPGRYGSTSRPIPTHVQGNLLIDRQTISDLRWQGCVRQVVTSRSPSVTDTGKLLQPVFQVSLQGSRMSGAPMHDGQQRVESGR
jgi:hypothetical protein